MLQVFPPKTWNFPRTCNLTWNVQSHGLRVDAVSCRSRPSLDGEVSRRVLAGVSYVRGHGCYDKAIERPAGGGQLCLSTRTKASRCAEAELSVPVAVRLSAVCARRVTSGATSTQTTLSTTATAAAPAPSPPPHVRLALVTDEGELATQVHQSSRDPGLLPCSGSCRTSMQLR